MSADGLIIAPLITEKGTIASEKANQVIFRVRPEATKDKIRLVVEEMFKVTVMAVRTSNFLGKERRRGQSDSQCDTSHEFPQLRYRRGIVPDSYCRTLL